ncbi:MAG: type II CRISPR-associated endonuclease Cas1 [Rhodospirillum sp.]|nr:type II CRISPR-associated endonuclease Cas1 [Rhodospirillum sp.]MCF8492102.1 type II CRISPR-associated endonuclease Cas1 [Rhodospirillum sp.]MCF8502084.1 type II CRISPR-associated endonuclease Cas1 [Rhodospirillum sp.]
MWRVVDISGEGRTLTLNRDSLRVTQDAIEVGRVPLADIQSVLIHGHGAMLSASLLARLAELGIPVVLCGRNHMPVSLTLPVVGNGEQAPRMTLQAEAALPTRKRIWKGLVTQKILAQAKALERIGATEAARLRLLAREVRSGDPDNKEAQAARLYWPVLMGRNFRRDPDAGGLNAPLNYGYTVLRAAVARAICAAGLNPSLGVFHSGKRNPFQLADDLVEPFRPLVDLLVWRNAEAWRDKPLTPEMKAILVAITDRALPTDQGAMAVPRVMIAMALSLVDVFMGDRANPWMPDAWEAIDQGSLDLD